MSIGIRQDCPILALLSILLTKIMNIQLRNTVDAKGDITLTLKDKSSIKSAVKII